MDYRLISLDYQGCSLDITHSHLPVTIGRNPDSDFCLDDPSVSGHHCVIERRDGALMVRDLGSDHGTFVNGALVAESELAHGDELCVGMLTFLVQSFSCRGSHAPSESELKAAR